MADLPETKTIALRQPVKLGELEFTHLELREPTAGEWIEFDKLEGIAADVKAVATVSGVPEPAVKMIGARDFREAAGFIAAFLS